MRRTIKIPPHLKAVAQQLDDVINTINAVRGQDYTELVLINVQMQALMEVIAHCNADVEDKKMIMKMVSDVGKEWLDCWRFIHHKDEAELKKWAHTIPDDMVAVLRVAKLSRKVQP